MNISYLLVFVFCDDYIRLTTSWRGSAFVQELTSFDKEIRPGDDGLSSSSEEGQPSLDWGLTLKR